MKHLQVFRCIADIARRGSIRRSAEHLHITPSALTRKIQEFEEEFGTPIFERLPRGMRLNAAGELLMRHIQDQLADFERLCSQVADLSGIRRGHVSLACSQAFTDSVLPDEIAAYRAQFPQVSFSVAVRDHAEGVKTLVNFEADLALLLDPPLVCDLEELLVMRHPLCAVMSAAHPLAQHNRVRLRDCCEFPLAMPDQSLAIRALFDKALYGRQVELDVPVESGSLEFLRAYVLRDNAITFQIQHGVPCADERICVRPIDTRDIAPIRVVLSKLKGRSLPLATERFAALFCEHWADGNRPPESNKS
ncbi:LysR family transcriptional regulator [Zymobacter palmae]|uniref:Transcriptional regulator n=1 Tax=Zymobacter palmae TaxID=33074 RepID=A0A348HC34_9GAMM|nr:LysR family transcriptional regulator [Zymobacter palmae]BBG29186.1 transcriptional regulator [Zymobacter palmae]